MIDQVVANAILNKVLAGLHTVLRSPATVAPGEAVRLSLNSAAPEIGVAEIINGALNLAWVSKDVVYKDAKSVAVPRGNFQGDDLANSQLFSSPPEVLGGDHFPPFAPFPLPTTGAVPTITPPAPGKTNVPGLLGQIFGNVEVNRPALPKLSLKVKWIVRTQNGNVLAEGRDFVAPDGLTSPDVSLLMLPLFRELRLDTIDKPPVEFRCIYAQVTLTIDEVAVVGKVTRVVALPPVAVMTLPLLIPTVVAIGKHHDFDPAGNGVTLIIVPEHSPLSCAEDLNDTLGKIRDVLSKLSSLAKVATFLLGLRSLNSALSAPYIGFFATDELPVFNDIIIGSRFFGLDDISFDDEATSVLVIGMPRTRVQFFNDQDFDRDEGKFDLRAGAQLYVLIRNLKTSEAEPQPKTFPNPLIFGDNHLLDFVADPKDNDFNDSMSSVRFDPRWIAEIRGAEGEIEASKQRPAPTPEGFICPPLAVSDPGVVVKP